jgi:hypothetical protein
MLYRPLFWTREYANLHCDSHKILNFGSGVIAVSSDDSTIIKSPGRATFGGIWSDYPLTENEFSQFLTQFRGNFPHSSQLQISLPPEYFWPEIFLPQSYLLSQINSHSYFEVNFHIDINSKIDISKGNRKKQRQFIESKGDVRIASKSSWREIYNLLSENRLRRGVNISMPWEIFEKSLLTLPKSFQLWQASVDKNIIGAALTVKIDEKTLYVLFWGDSLQGRQMSVVASISKHLIEYCKQNFINILDLGISSVNGEIDENLARFKRNLGAIESKKHIYSVSLN